MQCQILIKCSLQDGNLLCDIHLQMELLKLLSDKAM
jgi:hypothetical protein